MAEPARKKAIYTDFEAVPSNLVVELVYGARVTHPRPLPRHRVAASFGAELIGAFLGRSVVVPDIVGWRRARLSALSEAENVCTPPFEAAPFPLGLLWPFDEPNDAGEAPQS